MITYLSGAVNATMLNHPRPDLGAMLNPGGNSGVARDALTFLRFAADNGLYAIEKSGRVFDPGDWLVYLGALRPWRQNCLFAVAPDRVGDAPETLRRARPFLPTIRQLGLPAAFVSQDGCDEGEIPWDDFDCLFVGGSDAPAFDGHIWKLCERSWALCAEARRRGKWVHLGRVNSLIRLQAARVSLLDSCDGTFVKYGPDRRIPELYDWLDVVNGPQAVMEGLAS